MNTPTPRPPFQGIAQDVVETIAEAPIPDAEISNIKVDLNELLFKHLPGHTTLAEMENAACNALSVILSFIKSSRKPAR